MRSLSHSPAAHTLTHKWKGPSARRPQVYVRNQSKWTHKIPIQKLTTHNLGTHIKDTQHTLSWWQTPISHIVAHYRRVCDSVGKRKGNALYWRQLNGPHHHGLTRNAIYLFRTLARPCNLYIVAPYIGKETLSRKPAVNENCPTVKSSHTTKRPKPNPIHLIWTTRRRWTHDVQCKWRDASHGS